MSREGAATREHNSPGKISNSSVQFAIDEIADPSETEPDRESGSVDIGGFPEIKLVLPTKYPASDYQSQTSAVKRHSTVPSGGNFKRVSKIVREIVEQNVP